MSSYVRTSAMSASGRYQVSGFRFQGSGFRDGQGSGCRKEVRSTAMRTMLTVTALIIGILSAIGTAHAQTTRTPSAPLASAPGDQMRRLTIDEAVTLALDNKLGVQIARIKPQVPDPSVRPPRSAWG